MPKWRIYLFEFIIFITKKIPWLLVNALGDALGWLWFDFFRIRRVVIDENLKKAFPDWDEGHRQWVGRFSVRVLTRSFTQVLKIPSIDQKWIEKNVIIEGEEYLQNALKEGRGCYLLSMHLGCGDIAMSVLARRSWPIVLISKNFKNKFLNDYWFFLRGKSGARFINPHSPNNAFEILKEIKSKNIVIFVLDQFMGKPFGVATKFFGHETGTAYGLALFAQKTKSPVLPVYTFWDESEKLHIVFEPVIALGPLISNDKEASLVKITQKFNDVIEAIVRRYPQHWMWVHKRWKVFE